MYTSGPAIREGYVSDALNSWDIQTTNLWPAVPKVTKEMVLDQSGSWVAGHDPQAQAI